MSKDIADRDWDEDKEAYASLADEMNDGEEQTGPWVESDWDAEAVAAGKRYAKRNGLRWPPQIGDYDRFWERENNA